MAIGEDIMATATAAAETDSFTTPKVCYTTEARMRSDCSIGASRTATIHSQDFGWGYVTTFYGSRSSRFEK